MRSRCSSAHAVEELWTLAQAHRFSTRPRVVFSKHLRNRTRLNFSSTASNDTRNVAVIGGGITGLATAYHLAKDQSTKVTIWERSDRLGGWLDSERINVNIGGDVLFDYGPRTLRATASAFSTLELINEFGLEKQILRTGIHDAASRNRYIYYPDHLVRLPGPQPGAGLLVNLISNAIGVFTEPALKSLPWALATEPLRPSRPKDLDDESVGDFVARRLGKDVADNIVSAVFHGIYAGDIYKLSVKTILPRIWEYEISRRGIFGSLLNTKRTLHLPYDLYHEGKIIREEKGKEFLSKIGSYISGASVFALKGGMGQLVEALDTSLSNSPNVEIITGSSVDHIERRDTQWRIGAKDYNCVVSTTSSAELRRQIAPILTNTGALVALESHNYAVNVMVVNFFFRSPNLVPVHGFGYLIPRSIPLEQNPERALGVVFMSDSNVGQDTARGTKLTVMIGGHWWDGWRDGDFPDERSGIQMAKAVLKRHLHINEEPIVAKAKLLKNAIPQYTVGHTARMKDLHFSLSHVAPGIRLAGAWYTGVGVNDCTRAARLTAHSILSGKREETGLEKYLDENVAGYEVPLGSSG
ncbi:protoporphyrinogen oxidase [Coccidioides immitis RS]|uniref:Protoporphyrinogen oxidase n=2 Tax=Coccidioides immitis TaxID=5501 RepID=J3KIF8_COCIM|nr:protoporphyrinogen oxidase [Coccidioides immitis RS]EAS35752.3 protoporphyrinogen oxidase [Coccidioides immitis RS]KMP01035.1 protoporphyrinogen oxidase [Coccidioides immitis RMSCC 2394]TPX26031.1 oxygen-dependent protoporphyrinogen oxidase [Coccidioides immitis]